MTAFFVYSHDGAPQEPTELEFAPNLEIPQRQLRCRVAEGTGEAAFISELPAGQDTVNSRDWDRLKRSEEWPQGTKDARVWVWWRYAADGVPDVVQEPADEVWTLTEEGAVDRQKWAADIRPRVREGETA